MRSLAVALAICSAASVAQAVIIGPGDGTQNTTGTGMSSGWNYVGTVNGASGVYLGNGWVLTAAHVGVSSFTLSGVTYSPNSGATRLHNGDSSNADLILFHLATSPNLPWLTIGSSTPTNGTTIYMVGYGRDNRNTSATYYTVNTVPSTWTWTVDSNYHTADAGGLGYGTSQIKRWGTNKVDGTTSIDAGYGMTSLLAANFYGTSLANGLSNYINSTPGTTYEALVSSGDSGGGVFDSSGTLLGVNNYLGTVNGQPADTAIFGDVSYMADLSVYRSQIVSVVPEPSPLLITTAVLLPIYALRRRSRQQEFVPVPVTEQ